MSTPKSEASSRARTPRRPAARGKWSEEQLLTSDKSVLIDLDLVKLLARPEAWNCLDESDKRDILALLPPDVHPEAQATLDDPDAKIQPIPDSFIRYSNNWRDGIRQFQIDLQNGRYDPEWLRQAQEARQQRDNGDFDDFKEREYEQFWGQKQKVIWDAPAGESARVKMGTLIDEGVIQLGDVWKFYYVYGRGPGRIVIEKEVRVVDRDGVQLTFAIPPGERVFLRSNFDKSEPFSTPEKGKGDVEADLDTQPQPVTSSYNDKQLKHEKPESQLTNQTSNGEEVKLGTDQAPHETPASSNDEEVKLDNGRTPHEIPISSTDDMNIDTGTATQPVISHPDTPMDSSVATIEAPVEAPTEVPAVAPVEAEQDEINKPLSTEEQKDPIPTPSRTTTSEPDEIIVPDLSSPQALVRKILQIDGRMPNGRTANAWKEIRCYRNNQDMGSLFDVREAWFLQHGRHE
ncbi:Pc20g12610 [Penicillium rubens Wisconsin 54-1255]|uniref:Pc20g12610 protein n=1 Tax=Penicillium rubens (strain ATCC 28089 / DSM 1075 / NRRL 1951 / Wisconsin 54-1255) TaxID=500485 RepID=B6HDP7_PENRW|nr:Pc20g12610 [Penicillium rubens Wisconsin 54-1255]